MAKRIRLIFVLAVGCLIWTSTARAEQCNLGAGPAGEQCSFECAEGRRMSVGVTGVNVGVRGECNGAGRHLDNPTALVIRQDRRASRVRLGPGAGGRVLELTL